MTKVWCGSICSSGINFIVQLTLLEQRHPPLADGGPVRSSRDGVELHANTLVHLLDVRVAWHDVPQLALAFAWPVLLPMEVDYGSGASSGFSLNKILFVHTNDLIGGEDLVVDARDFPRSIALFRRGPKPRAFRIRVHHVQAATRRGALKL